jgi:small subunit ribosomal protein S21
LIEVKVRRGQSIEKALSIFKKKVKDSKILFELREREYYMKPSAIKKEKKAKAKARRKRESKFD